MIGWPWWRIIRVNFLYSVSPTEAFWVTCRDRAERKPTITFKVWLAKQFPWNINPPFTLRWSPASTGKPGTEAGYRWHVCGCRPAGLQLWTELMQDESSYRDSHLSWNAQPFITEFLYRMNIGQCKWELYCVTIDRKIMYHLLCSAWVDCSLCF